MTTSGARSVTGPLSSIEVRPAGFLAADRSGTRPSTPLALRALRRAPGREVPEHTLDPVRQVAVDADGRPLVPRLAKDWTTVEGTHTDGDGGDNEMWGWEEI